MIQKKISLLVMALVLLVSGIFININANEGDDKDTVSLTVYKVWENLPEDFEVEGIEAVLLRNEEVVDTITLDDSNSWVYTWNGLEAFDEAEELYEYRVEELNVGEDFEVSYQTSEEAKEIEVVITSTYLEPEEPSASIDDMEAIVDLEDIQAFSDEEEDTASITFTFEYVRALGIETPEYAKFTFGGPQLGSIILEFNEANNWTVTIEGLKRFDEEGELHWFGLYAFDIPEPFRFAVIGSDWNFFAGIFTFPDSCEGEDCNINKNLYGTVSHYSQEGIIGTYQNGPHVVKHFGLGLAIVEVIWENVPEGKELPLLEIGVEEWNGTNEGWKEPYQAVGFFTLDGSETVPWAVNYFGLGVGESFKFEVLNALELQDYEVSFENEGQLTNFKSLILRGGPTDPSNRSLPYSTHATLKITLTYIGEDPVDPVSITATKNWENLPEGKEISGVEVALLRNGEAIDTTILNDTNNWTYTWDDLDPVDENNQPYEYTVEERNVSEDFEVSYETEIYCAVPQDNEEDCNDIKVEITNTYIDPEKPIDPKEPEKPINPEKPQEPELPNTGISQSISYLLGLMMIASGLLLVLVTKKRRLENKS